MANTGYRAVLTKHAGLADSVDLKPTVTTAVTFRKKKSTRKKRRRSRKTVEMDVDALDHDPQYPSPFADEDYSHRDITPTDLSLTSHRLVDEVNNNTHSNHTLMTHISIPRSPYSSLPSPPPPPPLSPPPLTPSSSIHTDLTPQRRRAGEEDYPLRYLKTLTIVPPLPLLSPPPPPPPPTPPPTPPPPPPSPPLLPSTLTDEDNLSNQSFKSTKIVPPTLQTPPPADVEDNVSGNIQLLPPCESGDNQLHPIELLKQMSKRFKLECDRRRRKTVILNEKAQARNIAEQAKHIVIAAKRGWSYDTDNLKGITWTDNDEPSAVVRSPEYAELERLGLGKYDSSGCWIPNSTRLKNKFLSFR